MATTKENQGPARGAAQSTDGKDGVKVITNSRQVEGSVIKNASIGTSTGNVPSAGIVLQGLGSLDEELKMPIEDDPDSGDGDYVVVLHDYVSGAGLGFRKGDVRKLSKFIPTFDDKERLEDSRASAKRLFDLGAIRLATSDERGAGKIDIVDESDAIKQERAKRMALEQEIARLKGEQTVASPNAPAGAEWE